MDDHASRRSNDILLATTTELILIVIDAATVGGIIEVGFGCHELLRVYRKSVA